MTQISDAAVTFTFLSTTFIWFNVLSLLIFSTTQYHTQNYPFYSCNPVFQCTRPFVLLNGRLRGHVGTSASDARLTTYIRSSRGFKIEMQDPMGCDAVSPCLRKMPVVCPWTYPTPRFIIRLSFRNVRLSGPGGRWDSC